MIVRLTPTGARPIETSVPCPRWPNLQERQLGRAILARMPTVHKVDIWSLGISPFEPPTTTVRRGDHTVGSASTTIPDDALTVAVIVETKVTMAMSSATTPRVNRG